MNAFDRIVALLKDNEFSYQVLEHEHVHTSKDAAKVRGNRIEEAAKALILQDSDGTFYQFIVSGHRRLHLGKIKKLLGTKNISLAHPDEVLKLTGLTVGCIPPFGGLFHIPVYVDEHVLDNGEVCFSAGSHVKSIRMKAKDFVKACEGQVVAVAQEE